MPEGEDNKNTENRYLPYCPKKQPFQGLGIVIAAAPRFPGSADERFITP